MCRSTPVASCTGPIPYPPRKKPVRSVGVTSALAAPTKNLAGLGPALCPLARAGAALPASAAQSAAHTSAAQATRLSPWTGSTTRRERSGGAKLARRSKFRRRHLRRRRPRVLPSAELVARLQRQAAEGGRCLGAAAALLRDWEPRARDPRLARSEAGARTPAARSVHVCFGEGD